jgi:Fur family ferric uptake transcriptional regulator/Fur family peroxide stress response transcriptional regulator
MKTQIDAIDRLQQFGVKPSMQRIAVMNYLLKNYTHPTADTIFNSLYPSIPTLSKTTVYNTLKLLAQQGAILEITIDDKNLRYDAEISQHAHFKCINCGRVHDITLKNSKALSVKKIDNLLITDAQLYYKGYCEKCNTKIA